MDSTRLITLARLGKPHGLQGALRLEIFGGTGEAVKDARYVFVGATQLDARRMEIESIRGAGGRTLVKFKGMEAPEHARTLTGSRVFLRRSEFPTPGEGEYYWADLVGLRVRAGDQDLGIVEEILDTAAFDLLVVRGTEPAGSGREEHLVPFTQATLQDVRLAEGLILVGPPEEWETVRGKPEPDGNEPQKERGDEDANRPPGKGRHIRKRAKSKQEG